MVVSRDDIARAIRERIESGEYPAGSKLPGSRELASRYGAARNTANEALRSLAREGLISLRGKSPAVVVEPADAESAEARAREGREELKQVRDEMRETRSQLTELEQRLSSALGKLES